MLENKYFTYFEAVQQKLLPESYFDAQIQKKIYVCVGKYIRST